MGFIVFSLGLIVAIIGAAKPSPAAGQWPDTSIVFWVGAAVAAVGCYLWRQQLKKSNVPSGSAESGGEGANAVSLLKNFKNHIDQFQSSMEGLDAAKLHENAEKFYDDHIIPIVENRNDLIHLFGMSKGAEIILEFSRGERYFNRMHTAALDGHLQEATSSWPKAYEAFRSAIGKL